VTTEPEFGGVIGTAFLTVMIVLVVLLVTHKDWLSFPFLDGKLPDLLVDPVAYVRRAATPVGFGLPVAWWVMHAVLHIILPAEQVLGAELATGHRLPYRINGFSCVVASLAIAAAWHVCAINSWYDLTPGVSLHWLAEPGSVEQLAFGTLVLCVIKSTWLYAASFQGRRLLAAPGNSGSPSYDWFMGRELNPRVRLPLGLGVIDLKFFNELRPGMSAWLVLALAPVLKHLDATGALQAAAEGRVADGVRPEILAVAAMQLVYVLDSVLFERAILTTIDIIMDGFGFMLCAGDLAWVPFTFSLQTRFMVQAGTPLPAWQWAAALAVGTAGYLVFRLSNLQKDQFKRDMDAPAVAGLATIPPRDEPPRANGGRLLAGGWWAASRHINYLGDWLLGLSWCLLTGFQHPVPYLYAAYFAVLLVHRERRDDHKCAAKYGEHWAAYCRAVPCHIVPGLY